MGKGLFIIHTGDGKGKTCAALGQAIRAAGQGMRVCIIQFIKNRPCGELKALERWNDLVEIHQVGSGFSWQERELTRFRHCAELGWQLAREKISRGEHELIILDELTYLLKFGILQVKEVLEALEERRAGTHLLITGREAPAELVEAADLVTSMQEVKHPYRQGVASQKGIEW